MRRGLVSATVAGLAGLVLSGCFTTGADFGADAESYIVDSEQLRKQLFPGTDTTFTEAECVDPDSSDVGEEFTCTATDSNGDAWEFDVEITAKNAYLVRASRGPLASDTAGD